MINRQINERRGAAAVEAALLLPILVIVTLGIIDIGQFIVVKQNLCNATRLAARHAAKDSTINTAEVTSLVNEYFAENFPQLSAIDLNSAASVSIENADGVPIVGNQLEEIGSGEPVVVFVSIDFGAVRWLDSVDYWNLDFEPVGSFARRE